MLKTLWVTALATVIGAAPSAALSADLDGSKSLLCATIDVHFCDAGEVCYRTLSAILGAPQFAHINFTKKMVIGSKRSTAIRCMEPGESRSILQGTELGYGWSSAARHEDRCHIHDTWSTGRMCSCCSAPACRHSSRAGRSISFRMSRRRPSTGRPIRPKYSVLLRRHDG
ncbi:hypothetical protein [Burkholderia stabilis]|uniref:hypothetical protein n=1 Tax=Burkholderia stabilis TaxID=95485 RepID=UPI001F0BBA45|nr:hypothetical protein [Burkholderia stabilis]